MGYLVWSSSEISCRQLKIYQKTVNNNFSQPTEKDILSVVQKLHGTTANYRSDKQKERSLLALVKKQSPVVTVLPTEGGKTDCILVPALLYKEKIHIVVTPLVQLAKQLKEQAESIGITCVIWKSGLHIASLLIVVIANSFISNEFSQYLRDFYLRKAINLMTFDEAHQLLADVNYQGNHLVKRILLEITGFLLSLKFLHSSQFSQVPLQ